MPSRPSTDASQRSDGPQQWDDSDSRDGRDSRFAADSAAPSAPQSRAASAIADAQHRPSSAAASRRSRSSRAGGDSATNPAAAASAPANAAAAASAPSPGPSVSFDFENSTLLRLDAQLRAEGGPGAHSGFGGSAAQQQGFVHGIMHPPRFSSDQLAPIPSAVTASAAPSSSSHASFPAGGSGAVSAPLASPAPAAAFGPGRTGSTLSKQPSAFLMQDRIQFFERYPVHSQSASAAAAAAMGAGGLQAVGTATAPSSSAAAAAAAAAAARGTLNEPVYSLGTSTRARHATSTSSFDHVGSGQHRHGGGPHSERVGQSLAGSGAPPVVTQKHSQGRRQRVQDRAASIAVGFGSSSAKVASHLPAAQAPQAKGQGSLSLLPAYLAPDTSRQLEEAERRSRADAMRELAAAGGGSFENNTCSPSLHGAHPALDAVGSSVAAAGTGFGTISMGEHCRLVNEALSAQTGALLRVYRERLASEAARLAADVHYSSSGARGELQRLAQAYHQRLSGVSAQLQSLGTTRARAQQLQLSNAALRVRNLELARAYDGELSDMRLEARLLAEQLQAHAAPLAQVQSLERHIAAREVERRRLERECREARREVQALRPRLEAALAEAEARTRALHDQLVAAGGAAMLPGAEGNFDAAAAAEADQSSRAEQVAHLTSLQNSIGAQVASNAALQLRVEALRAASGRSRAQLAATEKQLGEARAAYDAEVGRGIAELAALQAELSRKAVAFDQQHRAAQSAAELAAALHQRLRVDLLCRSCMGLLQRPVVLWPCGHTLCESCVTRVPAESALGAAAAAAAPPGTLVTVCTECRYNFDHPVTRDDEEDGANSSNNNGISGGVHPRRPAASRPVDGDDVSFPNPFFDPPANFNGAFYAAPNVLMAKLVDAYKACCSRLESVLPQCASLSHTADDVAAYLAQTDSTDSGAQLSDKAERQADKTTAAAKDE